MGFKLWSGDHTGALLACMALVFTPLGRGCPAPGPKTSLVRLAPLPASSRQPLQGRTCTAIHGSPCPILSTNPGVQASSLGSFLQTTSSTLQHGFRGLPVGAALSPPPPPPHSLGCNWAAHPASSTGGLTFIQSLNDLHETPATFGVPNTAYEMANLPGERTSPESKAA